MKLNWNKRKKSEAARKIFRSGVYSAAVTALVLVLVILLNLIVRAIPSRYTEWDLSEAGLYTLSDNSIEVVKNLTQDVKIYYLAETGNEDVIISKLLDHYAAESSHLSWELKDPALYPTFATQYGATDVTNGSLILACGENSTVLDAADLYEEDYSNYSLTGTSSVTFDLGHLPPDQRGRTSRLLHHQPRGADADGYPDQCTGKPEPDSHRAGYALGQHPGRL